MVLLSPAMVGSSRALGSSSSLKIAQSSKVGDLLVFLVFGGLYLFYYLNLSLIYLDPPLRH
jgi:hypothetical protein